ncbi:hypothetical protein AB0D38_01180 [Streptomyces sp. NPDC048279]|jgi:hypothetical protein|uniref:hypothetical protein n=1 Tax=Streptomyces sp. NPDC048279 TaxID=3154714 RepID=UPI00341BA834
MRRTTVHRASLAAATLLLLAGCGSQSGSTDQGSGTVSSSPSPGGPAASPSQSGSTGGCTPATSELTAADDRATVCVAVGGTLRLTLDGTEQRPWKAVTVSGDALRATNGGIVLQPGDASAAYTAVASGTVTLTSSRPLCAEPTAPGGVSCKGIQEWQVTVRVK